MQKIFKFYYSLFHLRVEYSIDERGRVVRAYPNKPINYMSEDEQHTLQNIIQHFLGGGYLVLVEE